MRAGSLQRPAALAPRVRCRLAWKQQALRGTLSGLTRYTPAPKSPSCQTCKCEGCPRPCAAVAGPASCSASPGALSRLPLALKPLRTRPSLTGVSRRQGQQLQPRGEPEPEPEPSLHLQMRCTDCIVLRRPRCTLDAADTSRGHLTAPSCIRCDLFPPLATALVAPSTCDSTSAWKPSGIQSAQVALSRTLRHPSHFARLTGPRCRSHHALERRRQSSGRLRNCAAC